MKKSFMIILVLIIFSCEKSKKTKIDRLIIHSVNLNIDTAIEVDCKDFESTFSKKIKVDSIEDESTLSEFESLLQKTTKNNNSKSFDVRRKIFVFYKDNSIDTLCVDRFNIMINNQLINKNNSLLGLVHSL